MSKISDATERMYWIQPNFFGFRLVSLFNRIDQAGTQGCSIWRRYFSNSCSAAWKLWLGSVPPPNFMRA
jgi:hypothetical protein